MVVLPEAVPPATPTITGRLPTPSPADVPYPTDPPYPPDVFSSARKHQATQGLPYHHYTRFRSFDKASGCCLYGIGFTFAANHDMIRIMI
jgi:hypothetical protein